MSDCINRECSGKKDGVCLNDFPGVKCYGYEPPRITNADRLRAMSDEELAQWLCDMAVCQLCPIANCPGTRDCETRWLDWLRQEVTNDP